MAANRTATSDYEFDAPASKPSGWDGFLSGAARFSANFLTGLGAGLQAYNPQNPYASLGAAMTAAMPGVSAGIKREQRALDVAAAQEQDEEALLGRAKTLKEIEDLGRPTTVQAAAASIIPGGEAIARPVSGIAAGIAKPSRAVSAPELFDIKVGGYPSPLLPPSMTAAERVMFMGGSR
jgi:hypothetical protein